MYIYIYIYIQYIYIYIQYIYIHIQYRLDLYIQKHNLWCKFVFLKNNVCLCVI